MFLYSILLPIGPIISLSGSFCPELRYGITDIELKWFKSYLFNRN